jgi:hypothetical protein
MPSPAPHARGGRRRSPPSSAISTARRQDFSSFRLDLGDQDAFSREGLRGRAARSDGAAPPLRRPSEGDWARDQRPRAMSARPWPGIRWR